MTRVNVIEPRLLTDQHLMAEYREIPMVPASLKRSKNSKRGLSLVDQPKEYTLNKGHVKHFYDKGKWLYRRYYSLVDELVKRGYNVDPQSRNVKWDAYDQSLFNDWEVTQQAVDINLERILERVKQKSEPWYRYYGELISYDGYVNIINSELFEQKKENVNAIRG